MLKYFMFVSLVILHSNARDNGMYYVVDNGISSPYTSTPNYELGGRRYMNSFQKLQPVFDEKVTLQLYYECLCPDCREFDTHDFQDTVHKLGPYLNIYLYPFGNAQFVEHEGHYEFTCQHGPKECYGNKLHACAIDHLKNMTLAVFYNSCMMDYSQLGNGSDDRAADLCGLAMNIDSNAIKKCAKSERGDNLLHYFGVESKKANFKYVPYILINGEENDGKNFMRDVCNNFRYPPPVCRQL